MNGGRRPIVVLGMMTTMPVAGIVWLTIPYLVGLRRLGFDPYYVEAHARTPSMLMRTPEDDGAALAASFIDGVMRRFDFSDRWAYHALHADGRVYGLSDSRLSELYRSAALLVNLHGGTEPQPEHVETERLVLIETDPVELEIELHRGDEHARRFLDAHCAVFTWGANFGNPDCRVPLPAGVEFRPSRMPILMDQWRSPELTPRDVFTTVGNWQQGWRDVEYEGVIYTWSKHEEFNKFLDLPRRTGRRFELALASCDERTQEQLRAGGWDVRPATEVSSDLDTYRRYIVGSRGEFTVAKDQNVRLRSGWFSDRSAAYLAAGRPVVTQETGFSNSLPVGDGLMAFATLDEAVDGIERVDGDYRSHSRAARSLAREFFDYRIVLGDMLDQLDAWPHPRARAQVGTSAARTPRPLPRRAACTIIAKNYLAHARVLAQSFSETNPGVPFFVLLADRNDGTIVPEREPFELIEIDDLGAPDLLRFCFQYSVIELSTAAKPYFLAHLVQERGFEQIVYFDPDILVVDRLDELWRALDSSSIVLTPHLTEPLPDDGKKPSEIDILLSGTYNLGFLALASSDTTTRLLDWWQERLYDRCVVAPDEGLFTDQRWMDLVPGFFDDVHVLRDPGYNVAYWNLDSRVVTVTNDAIRVNGDPAYFFHFSGFDPNAPLGISRHQNRFRLDELGDLELVFERYRRLLFAAGCEAAKSRPYAFGQFDNGVAIPDLARSLYRRLGHDVGRFGDPFATGPVGSFFRWLNEPVSDDAASDRPISRLWYEVYGLRPDVRHTFPDLFDSDRDRFLDWAQSTGLDELGLDPALRPGAGGGSGHASEAPARSTRFGVNVIGHFRAETGMGEAVRSDVRALESSGVPFALDDVPDPESVNTEAALPAGSRGKDDLAFDLIHLNADQLPRFAASRGAGSFEDRYTIGYWTWELSEFPSDYLPSFAHVDEVWVPSTFALDAIARRATKPVLRIPHALDPDAPTARLGREHFRLPRDAFLFLFMFDFRSVVERKNPFGLIEAFKRAFRPGEPVALVLKCGHPNAAPDVREALTHAAGGARVYFVDEALDRPQTTALLSVADAYASLHRSEGFGLTLAEAMALGKPVVATGYSGNLDFMRPSNSFLVDYELVRLDRDHGPYPKGATWADPDVEQAAALLRLVADRSETVRERAAAGRQDVLKELHPRVAGRLISERLLEIDGRRREQRSAARIPAEADRPPLYATLVHRVRETVARVIPPRSDVAVVTRGDDQLLLLGDRRCSHFPRTAEGVYAGHYPADDDDAIAQLEEARASGDEYIVFPATARWWLDHYARLREHLDDHYLKVADDDSCVVYRLASVPANGAQPARPAGDADYPALVQALHERIRQTIPEGAAVAVVSKGDDDLVDLDGLRAWHFPTDGSGAWAGHYPADGRAAVGELEAVREQGVRYLAIPKSAFWWLGYYSDFAEHLRDRYDLVLTSADCLIYDLSPRSDLTGRRVLPRLFARRSRGS